MLPNISVVWVILAVLLLAVMLDRVLFKPLVRVMRERENAVRSAMEMAQAATAKAQAATAEFDANLATARADLYKQMDERRKVAEAYRAELMTKTRGEVDQALAATKSTLDAQTAAAKAQLEQDAESLGREIARKVLGRGAQMLVIGALVLGGPGLMAFQPPPAPEPHAAPAAQAAPPAETTQAGEPEHAKPAAGEHAAAEGGHEEQGNPLVGMIAKLLNFAVLAGTLVYFLRSPFNKYLSDRKTQIRSDLVKASEMKTSAAAQLEAVNRKMAALPGELSNLRHTGAAEVAAEEARIREIADQERARLLANMTREIAQHEKAADRQLVRLAADRAVAAATSEIEHTITPADHARLVERYVGTVGR